MTRRDACVRSRQFRDALRRYAANSGRPFFLSFVPLISMPFSHSVFTVIRIPHTARTIQVQSTRTSNPTYESATHSWKREMDAKNQRIIELTNEVSELESFLRDHSDTDGIRELRAEIQRKSSRVEELEDTVVEFENFLKQNPDVKDLHDLRHDMDVKDQRIRELEGWIREDEDLKIDKARIVELEGMVTRLENYVKEHNVDVLRRKLEDRESRLEQLQKRVSMLEKEVLRYEEGSRKSGRDKLDVEDPVTVEQLENLSSMSEQNDQNNALRRRSNEKDSKTSELEEEIRRKCEEFAVIRTELLGRERKMKEMEHELSEKDNRIQEFEQQIVEWQERLSRLQKEMAVLEKELAEYEAEDIGVLKEEIRVRDERVVQLEDEIDSLERAFSEQMDLEQIEELVSVVKEKEEREHELESSLMEKQIRIEELSQALRESVVITSEGDRKLKQEETLRRSALQRVTKLEQRIASIQTASALKCSTCRPLLSKLQMSEKKLQRLVEERMTQLEDLHQMKREALEAAVSEKDAHLALLELSGLKTAAQADQADKLRADRRRLLDRLKEEDERSIELSAESVPSSPEVTPSLASILEPVDDMDDNNDEDDNEDETTNDRESEMEFPRPTTTNGSTSDHGTETEGKTMAASHGK